MATILYLTDLYYQANSRTYYEEDLMITGQLRSSFDILIGHPQQALSYLHCADLIVFRNTGPVIYYRDYFHRFMQAVKEQGLITFNSLNGKGDRLGKGYLLGLTRDGYPVIPTVDTLAEISRLGEAREYVVKLINGADSIGMQRVSKEELAQLDLSGQIIQPYLDFQYEVSFYFLNNVFHYALYAPDKSKRWELKEYPALAADLQFANTFVAWDGVSHGIVRIDACRLQNGTLQLVEIEDLNPFLSLGLLPLQKQEAFLSHLTQALHELVDRQPS